MTETEVTYSRRESYSRSSRARKKTVEKIPLNQDFKRELLPTRMGLSAFWSFILSLLSVANPFLTTLATNIQSQALYTGVAMQAGQAPYGDFYGTSGVLYYLMVFLGSSFGTTIGIMLVQFLALWLAGIYLYKIVAYFSKQAKAARELSHWFYTFTFALSLGGLHAVLFALPFVLMGFWFLIRYFENAVRDEGFILYGIYGAVVFLIEPRSALLWLVAGLVLFVWNWSQHRLARGVYQFLSAWFGFLLVAYTITYYVFVGGHLSKAIDQTVGANFTLSFARSDLLFCLVSVAVLLFVSGIFKNSIDTLFSFGKNRPHAALKILVLLTLLVQLVLAIGSPTFALYQLVALLPYGFILAVIHARVDVSEDREGEQVSRPRPQPSYLKRNAFLPLFAYVAILLQPAFFLLKEYPSMQARADLAQYIKGHSESSDTIYAWDTSAQLYLGSGRFSSASLLTAEPYTQLGQNQEKLETSLSKNTARYVLVNRDVAVSEAVQSNLDAHYSVVDAELGSSQFTVYQKNE